MKSCKSGKAIVFFSPAVENFERKKKRGHHDIQGGYDVQHGDRVRFFSTPLFISTLIFTITMWHSIALSCWKVLRTNTDRPSTEWQSGHFPRGCLIHVFVLHSLTLLPFLMVLHTYWLTVNRHDQWMGFHSPLTEEREPPARNVDADARGWSHMECTE